MPPAPTPRLTWKQLRPRAKLIVVALLALATLAGLEVCARAQWRVRKNVPFLHTDRAWASYFEEWDLSQVATDPPHVEGAYDVLVLGASVMVPQFGVVQELQAGLAARLGRPVRLYNLSCPGRFSVDSRIKYEHLAGRHFDLVVVYHGINETSMNNCPPGKFRDDYSHAPRYAQLAALERHREVGWLALPATTSVLANSLVERLRLSDKPRREWYGYGGDLRTPPVFEANMERIAELARQRGDRLLLMTYAYYLAPGYTEEAFESRSLDYTLHVMPVENWGLPEHVTRGIDAHNAALRRVVARHPEALFVDQRALMPPGGRYWSDICHMIGPGSKRFVENILANVSDAQLGR
jgi:hypothetical protein